ncbi:ATP-binding cassette domain-containing protein [Paenibacillus sp. N3.4]|uniref:ATP-binding cassette domain-containing protein n=1 Tax=Paenibacillus sp. N3.4 TaxID=2603222 RepID=UPI0011CA953F|nr:ATP-binding cassette domain-containing protein [Paenibacillus sp. N3.4]TXK82498.1 ATP-binding cassette domain-containing protein [Paenibacillus sp. N3.4]
MLGIKKQTRYLAFGLNIASDFDFPELKQIDSESSSYDIEIKLSLEDRSGQYAEAYDKPNTYVVTDHSVQFYIPNVALFAVQHGRQISVIPMKDSDENQIRLYMLGTCMGAILMQRRVLPLHGSVVAIEGKAYAIVGESGAGKSTLASAFIKEGYQLLTDDVIAVSLSEEGSNPYVTSSYPQQKLWQESLASFGMETSQYDSIFGRETKYNVPMAANYFAGTLPLAGVIELVKSEGNEAEIRPIEKLARLQTLFEHTFRNFFVSQLGLTDWHFHTSVSVVKQIDMYRLSRPMKGFTAPLLVATILQAINKEE